MNSVSMSILCLLGKHQHFCWIYLRIARFISILIFSFTRYCQTFSHRLTYTLTSSSVCFTYSFVNIWYYLIFFFFFFSVTSGGSMEYLMILVCISVITNEVEDLFWVYWLLEYNLLWSACSSCHFVIDL